MKKIRAVNQLIYLLVMMYSSITYADEISIDEIHFHDLYAEQIVQSNQLNDLLIAYQQQWPQPLTVDHLLSTERQQEFFRIFRLLAIAIDANINIDNLAQYGVLPHSSKSYAIDLKQHPHWVGIRQLFNHLKQLADLDSHQYLMAKFGLSQTSIAEIQKYLIQQPLKKYLKPLKSQVRQKINTYVSENGLNELDAGHHAIETTRLAVNHGTNQWAKEFINRLEPPQQQKLIDYLYSQLNYIGIAKSPMSVEQLERIGKKALNNESENPFPQGSCPLPQSNQTESNQTE